MSSAAIRAKSPAAAVEPLSTAKSLQVPSTLYASTAQSDASQDDGLKVVSLAEVAENESWMVIYDKVYDLTDFFSEVIDCQNSTGAVNLPCPPSLDGHQNHFFPSVMLKPGNGTRTSQPFCLDACLL